MIQDMPNEILEIIFLRLREHHGLGPLANALRSCHLLNQAGTPVLYEHVVLNNRNIQKFLDDEFVPRERWSLTSIWRSFQRSPEKSPYSFEDAMQMFIAESSRRPERESIRTETWHKVRSLTLRIKPEGSGNLRIAELTRALDDKLTPIDLQLMRLAGMLSAHFNRLHTFSLYVEEKHYAGKTEMERYGAGFLDARVVQQLVKALPESCINLELDTNGREIQFGPTSPRLCIIIRRMMPRLRHLSLRIKYVCEALGELTSASQHAKFIHAPHLRSLTISFVPRNIPQWFDLMYSRNVCAQSHSSQGDMFEISNDGYLASHHDQYSSRLAYNLLEAHKQGCFPRIRQLKVVAPREIFRRGMVWTERETDDMILVRDCLEDTTYAHQMLPSSSIFHSDETRAIIDQHGVLLVGNHEVVKLHIENSAWESTVAYRARLPVDTSDVRFERSALDGESTREAVELLKKDPRQADEWYCIQRDLTERRNHPERIFEFAGASFRLVDFIPENF